MPWRGPAYPGEFPSLGWLAKEWIEDHLPVPDGDRQGEPLTLSDAQTRLVVCHYRIRPRATPGHWRAYRRSMKVGPKGWGKDPLLAAVSWFEACGPARFDGWDADGEPVGKPWATPWVQMVATSEDQTDNTYMPFRQMGEYGWLDDYRPDIGMTRTLLPGGGIVEPVTSAAATREGQRVTFAPLGETWQWYAENGGHRLAATVRRNVAKMGGATFEITNMWAKGRDSVAERTAAAAMKDKTILVELVTPQPPEPVDEQWPRLDNDRECLAAIRQVYEGHDWVNPQRILEDVRDPDTTDDEARRFYFNQEDDAASDFVSVDDWRAMSSADTVLSDRDFIVLGFDGSTAGDATALIGCRIGDGHIFTLGVWQPSDGETIDRTAVDAAVRWAFQRFTVWRMYGDPPHWQDYMDRWASEFGEDRVVEWWTNRRAAMGRAFERFGTASAGRSFTHDGDSTLAEHVLNARRSEASGHLLVRKEHRKSRKKIDACIAAVLAWEARGDAVSSGASMAPKRSGVVW